MRWAWLLFIALFQPLSWGAEPCPTGFARVSREIQATLKRVDNQWHRFRQSKDMRSFEPDLFEKFRAKYLADGVPNDKIFVPRSDEALLAAIEVTVNKGAFRPFDFVNVDAVRDAKRARRFGDLLKSVNLERGITAEQANDLVSAIYLLEHRAPLNFSDLTSIDKRALAAREFARMRIERALASKNFVNALQELRLIRSPDAWERAGSRTRRSWRGVINVLTGRIDKWQGRKVAGLIDPLLESQIEKAMIKGGFAEAYPLIESAAGNLIGSDYRLRWWRRVYAVAANIGYIIAIKEGFEEVGEWRQEQEREDAEAKTRHEREARIAIEVQKIAAREFDKMKDELDRFERFKGIVERKRNQVRADSKLPPEEKARLEKLMDQDLANYEARYLKTAPPHLEK